MNSSWSAGWEQDIQDIQELITNAYALDPDTQRALQEECRVRLMLQRDHESEWYPKLAAMADEARKIDAASGGDEPTAADEALTAKLKEMSDTMPLNEEVVAQWVEQRLSADKAKEGHLRFEELRDRRRQRRDVRDEDLHRMAARKLEFTRAEAAQQAVMSSSGFPLPPGQAREQALWAEERRLRKRFIKPPTEFRSQTGEAAGMNAGAAAGTPPAAQAASPPPFIAPPPPSPAPRSGETTRFAAGELNAGERPAMSPPPPVQPAPPLDEWDKQMASQAQKYQFDSGQLTRARSILSDLRKRAYQYRLTRADDYARASVMADARARAEALRRLNGPIDALFEELKLRIESLPTGPQRRHAAALSSPAKKGR